MGAIFGLIFTLNLLRLPGTADLINAPDPFNIFAGMLAFTIFETALGWGIILVFARVIERIYKSYTTGFYWSFIAIVLIEIVLTILRQPAGWFGV